MADFPPAPADLGLPVDVAVAAPAGGHVLYRIIRGATPTVHDFLSNRDKHDPQMRGEYWLLHVGLSMFADAAQAEAIRDRFRQDQYLAEVPLPGGFGFMLARTRRTAGHYTVWGKPEDLLSVTLDRGGYPGSNS